MNKTSESKIPERKKPLEEYQAEAMLLGMTYDADLHTFWTVKEDINCELDADTKEQLSPEELAARHREYFVQGDRSVTPGGNVG